MEVTISNTPHARRIDTSVTTDLFDQLALPDGLRAFAEWRLSLSGDRSATIRFNLAFSSSSCFNRAS